MRILIVSSFFPPLNSIASLRPYSWARYWSQAGHDVSVLKPHQLQDAATAQEYSSDGFHIIETPPLPWIQRLKRDYGQQVKSDDKVSTTSQIKQWIFTRLNNFRQYHGIFASCHMPDITDFWVPKALQAIKTYPCWDIVISTAPPFPVHRLGYEIKRRGMAKHWIADYRDLITESPIAPGLFPFSWIERRLEKRYMDVLDGVVTVSDGLKHSLNRLYPHANISVVENGFEPNLYDKLPAEPFFPDSEKYRIVYLGVIYPKQRDPSPLFQAIREISQCDEDKDLLNRLEVIFYGPEMGDLQHLISKYDVAQWVRYGGFVNHSTSLRIQRDANALLFLSWATKGIEGILTGKIFEYLASRTSILAVGGQTTGAAERLIEEAQCGHVLGDDVAHIKHHLKTVLAQTHWEQTSTNNTTILNRYTRETQATKLLEFMTALSR